jgi:hypothetical protein
MYQNYYNPSAGPLPVRASLFIYINTEKYFKISIKTINIPVPCFSFKLPKINLENDEVSDFKNFFNIPIFL